MLRAVLEQNGNKTNLRGRCDGCIALMNLISQLELVPFRDTSSYARRRNNGFGCALKHANSNYHFKMPV